VAIALAIVVAAAPTWGQAPGPEAEPPIEVLVASALFDRGMYLFGKGDVVNAKQLFIEALERNPDGPKSGDARSMVRTCNERLGIEDRDDGLPGHVSTTPPKPPEGTDVPVDPYTEAGRRAAVKPPANEGADKRAWLGLTTWSGAFGLTFGLGAAGPTRETEDGSELKGAAVLAGLLGAGAGVGASYWLSRHYQPTPGQSAAIATAGTWGTLNLGFLGDLATGDDSDPNDVFKFMMAGGAVGIGAGVLYAIKDDPTVGDVAVINSLGSYGTATGLLLGVAASPAQDEAYSLQAMLGSLAGLTAGVLLDDHLEISRERTLWLDLGAAAGAAATWVVIYPFIADQGTNNDEQAAGLLSTLTMAGGVVTMWLLTRDLDRAPPTNTTTTTTTSLMARDGTGDWQFGTPTLHPLPPHLGFGAMLSVTGGTF